jgi:hypothetical protein
MMSGTNDVIIHCGDEIRMLERTHGRLRKNTLRKYHHSIVADSGNRFMAIHSFERLLGLPVKALPVSATKLCSSMITPMDGN